MQLTAEDKKAMYHYLEEREKLKKKNIKYNEQKEYYTEEEVWGSLLELFYKEVQNYI